MTVLITGGTGFIGTEVARILLNKGEERPVVFDINPSINRLDDIKDQVEVVKGDLGNYSHVLDVVKKKTPNVIYHLGGMLSVPSEADPTAALRANVLGTLHVLETARLFNVSQVLFSSTIATYGLDIRDEVINDYTLQRPQLFYGATKVFGEHMGLFYKRKHGLDFRTIRYPSVVGPGVKSPGVVQFTSWVIEECAKGNPFIITLKPETKVPVIYFKDAAQAIVRLGEAPIENIKTVNYVITGANPIASAGELADIVRANLSGAEISFQPDLELQGVLDQLLLPLDDSNAQKEWGWCSEYDQVRIVEDFLQELNLNPQRYV